MYLGQLGRMIGIKCPAEQKIKTESRYSFTKTLGGSVKAQAGPISRREWDIRLGSLSTPSQVGVLMDFANGLWGVGPFWFVSADAPVVNMLTPEASSCEPSTVRLSGSAEFLGSPPMNTGDGVAARSLWKTSKGTATFGGPVPVLAGESVTGSAWVLGNGHVRLQFQDSSGDSIKVVDCNEPGSSTPKFLSVITKAPATATSVELVVTAGATQISRPAVTWTDRPFEWGDGQGCSKAVVHQADRNLVAAWRTEQSGRLADVAFTIQEVG